MARPRKESLDYFPMDVDFDDKTEVFLSITGNDGLAFFTRFLQAAYKTKDGRVRIDPDEIQHHAKKIGVTPARWMEILTVAIRKKLLAKETFEEEECVSSHGIQKRKEAVDKRRESWRSYQDQKDSERNVKTLSTSITPIINVDNHSYLHGKPVENPGSPQVIDELSSRAKAKQSKAKQSMGEPPTPSASGMPEFEPLGKSAEQIIANHDGNRTLTFEEILTVIEGQRDPDKHRNVSYNERGHLHKIYFADQQAEKLSIAVLKLSKTAWRGTLEQIEEVMQGKEPRSKHKTEHSTPQVPKAKPAKRAKNTGMTFEEAMNMTDPNNPLPF